jgi:transcriptional regulator with XRE-family HTH domain
MVKSLRDTRVERPMSIRELAKAAGISQVSVQNIESGKSRPLPETMRKVSAALGVEVGEIAEFAAAIEAKQTKNEGRNWPDWRTVEQGKAIEHDRSGEGAVTPAPAPQPVAPRRCGNPTCYAHDGETCAKGAMQREECEEWQRGTPQPVSGEVATCPRCRAPVGSSDTAAIKGSREVCYWAAGQRSEAAYDECARRAGAQVARLTRMLDSMTDQQHRACLREVEQERRADAAEARVAELEAERATLDARLLDAVQSVPTSAGKE